MKTVSFYFTTRYYVLKKNALKNFTRNLVNSNSPLVLSVKSVKLQFLVSNQHLTRGDPHAD